MGFIELGTQLNDIDIDKGLHVPCQWKTVPLCFRPLAPPGPLNLGWPEAHPRPIVPPTFH